MADQRRRTDAVDPWPATGGDRDGGHLGSLFLATVLGVGVGLLAAPQPGTKTRRALRKRLATVGEGIGEELEERSRPLRRAVRDRAEELRRRGRKKYEETVEQLEDLKDEYVDEIETTTRLGPARHGAHGRRRPGRGVLPDQRPDRSRARSRARGRGHRSRRSRVAVGPYQSRRGNGHPATESSTRIDPADSAPQAS